MTVVRCRFFLVVPFVLGSLLLLGNRRVTSQRTSQWRFATPQRQANGRNDAWQSTGVDSIFAIKPYVAHCYTSLKHRPQRYVQLWQSSCAWGSLQLPISSQKESLGPFWGRQHRPYPRTVIQSWNGNLRMYPWMDAAGSCLWFSWPI